VRKEVSPPTREPITAEKAPIQAAFILLARL
jgi:hypothetical protein